MDENTNINNPEPIAKGGEWVVDAEAIMKDGHGGEEAEAPSEAVIARPEGDESGESYELKHLDEVRTVSRDKVIELAQKGLDYDRVRSKLEAARDNLAALRAEAERAGVDLTALSEQPAQTGAGVQRARREVREFFAAHPDAAALLLRGEAMPDEVWRRVRGGESLKSAWEGVHLRAEAEEKAGRVTELERELAQTRQAKLNAGRSTGSVGSAGGDVERDMAAIGWNTV